MNQFDIISHPFIYLIFISLHLLTGQFFTGYMYWLRFGKSPIIYHKKNRNRHTVLSQWMSFPVVIWFSSICLYAFSEYYRQSIFGVPFFHLNVIYGWIIALIGLIGMLLCQYQMGESFRVGQELDKERSQNNLNCSSCFKYSRNPIYCFSIMYLIGVSLWVLIWPIWVSLIIIILFINKLIMEEELFLTQRFGEQYLQYKKMVPRYLFW